MQRQLVLAVLFLAAAAFVLAPARGADPELLSISPTFGPLSRADVLHLNGSGFLNDSTLTCGFNSSDFNTTSNGTFISDTAVSCQLPIFPAPTLVLVAASNDGSNFTAQAVYYEAIEDYAVTSLWPAAALAAATVNLTIEGLNFTDSTLLGPAGASIVCSLDGFVTAALYVNSTTLACELPVLGAGNYSVEVSLNGVDYTSNGLLYTALPLPSVLAIAPQLAVAGVSFLTLSVSDVPSLPSSSYLCAFSNDSAVIASTAALVTATQLRCAAPAELLAGQYVVEVSADGGIHLSSSLLAVDVRSAAVILSFHPLVAPVHTAPLLTILGSGFLPATQLAVTVGLSSCPVQNLSSTQLTCIAPVSAAVGDAVVSLSLNALDWVNASLPFSYTALPAITALRPALSTSAGGTLVTITGAALNLSLPVTVRVGRQFVAAVVVNDSEVHFLTPAQAAGDVDVSVCYDDAERSASSGDWSNALPFSYYDVQLLQLMPSFGPAAGGSTITLRAASYPPQFTYHCRINGSLTPAVWLSSTAISCLTPPADGQGLVSVSVTANGVVWSDASPSFLYYGSVHVLDAAPAFAPADVTTTVTVTGDGFMGWPPLLCLVDGAVSAAVLLSNSTALCSAPPHAVADVQLSLAYDGDVFPAGFTFSYLQPAAVSAVSPTVGPMYGGSVLTITGSGFVNSSGLSCRINASYIAAVYLSATQLTCDTRPVPAAGAYTVEVSLDGDSATASGQTVQLEAVDPSSASYSSYDAQWLFPSGPQVQQLQPTSGPNYGGTAVTLLGVGFVGGLTSCTFSPYAAVPADVHAGHTAVCVSPVNTDGLSVVALRVSNDNITLSASTVGFVYYAPPVLTAVALPTLTASAPEVGNTLPVVLAGSFPWLPLLNCSFGGQTVAAALLSPELLQCVPPDAASGTVQIAVSGNGGVNWSPDTLDFTYQPLPSVLQLTPAGAPLRGGVELLLSGSLQQMQNHSVTCLWDGSVRTAAAIADDGIATCSVPSAADLGWSSGPLPFVLQAEQQGIASAVSIFSFYTELTITAIIPSTLAVATAAIVDVYGTGFFSTPDASCSIGGVVVASVVVSSLHVQCVAPTSLPVGLHALDVSCDGIYYTSSGFQLQLYAPPVLDSLWPLGGAVDGGTVVTLLGSGFLPVPTLSCQFGSAVVSGSAAVFVSATQLLCTAPQSPAAATGTVAVSVALNGLDYVGSASFQYYQQPTIASLSASVGLSSGSLLLTVAGANFLTLATLSCRFQATGLDVVVAATVVSSTQLSCPTPAISEDIITGNTLPAELDVSQDGATYTGSPLPFQYQRLPLIASITPSAGVAAGGTIVIVTTAGTVPFAAAGCCSFDTVWPPRPANLVPWQLLNSSAVHCSSPSFYTTTVALEISSTDCALFSQQGTQFAFRPTPAVTAVSPPSGPVSGGYNVTVTGSAFAAVTAAVCSFASAGAVPAELLSASALSCLVPALPGAVGPLPFASALSVSMDGVYYTAAGAWFNYVEQATVLSLSPALLPLQRAQTITLHGSGFIAGPQLVCDVGGTTVPGSFVSDTEITCPAPPELSLGTVAVEMSSDGLIYTSNGLTFTVYQPPSSLSLQPPSGPTTGGVVVTVSGAGFDATGGVSCAWMDGSAVLTSANVLSATELTCVAPAYYDLVAAASSPRLLVPLQVVDASGLSTGGALPFAYELLPVLLSLWPTFTFDADVDGAVVTVSGSAFLRTANATCQFGGNLVPVLWLDSGTLLCTAPPASALGAVSVRVSLHQSGDWSNALPFLYCAEPSVLSIAPSSGSITGATTVAVRGANFFSTASAWCRFDTQQVAAVVLSPSQLSCSSPALANASTEQVTTVGLSISFDGADWQSGNQDFTYYPLASIASLQPTRGLALGGNVVTVTGSTFIPTDSQCSVGGRLSTNSTVVSSTVLLCTVPPATDTTISAPSSVAVQVGSSRVDLQACKLEYSIVSPK